eukprot:TRINITY_DN4391_c0_g2_i1.p1 TRINITY_DN4391_c0_g2~~TRINITY_DN4391_c0_g2_i1.p1  ORF type:complete len:170 (+),score=1.54 TRINITY_DN4391_c0_g2_i1:159-668(+)
MGSFADCRTRREPLAALTAQFHDAPCIFSAFFSAWAASPDDELALRAVVSCWPDVLMCSPLRALTPPAADTADPPRCTYWTLPCRERAESVSRVLEYVFDQGVETVSPTRPYCTDGWQRRLPCWWVCRRVIHAPCVFSGRFRWAIRVLYRELWARCSERPCLQQGSLQK